MTENWIEKIQQDAELQMLLGLAGGGLVLFVVLLIVIVVLLNKRKKKRAENPLGDIRVQSTHTPEIVEETKEHLVFRNKVSNEITEMNSDPDPEPQPASVISTPPVPEIPPMIPESPVHEPATPPKTTPEPEPTVIPSPSSVVIPPTASAALSEEEKKKVIFKAIEETRSREENLRILQERLRELRGETTVETSPPAAETQPREPLVKPAEEHIISIQTEGLPEVKQTEPAEMDVEVAKPVFESSDKSKIADMKQELVSEPTEKVVEVSQSVMEHSDNSEITDEVPEAAPFVQETILPVPEPEVIKHSPDSIPASDSPKTFTEWLSALSGKKR